MESVCGNLGQIIFWVSSTWDLIKKKERGLPVMYSGTEKDLLLCFPETKNPQTNRKVKKNINHCNTTGSLRLTRHYRCRVCSQCLLKGCT